MKYGKNVKLRNGKLLFLNSACEKDAKALIDHMVSTDGESDYIYSYPEEVTIPVADMEARLGRISESEDEVVIIAIIDGKIVGRGCVLPVDGKVKVKHRAECRIAVSKWFWGCGIGSAIMTACIACGKKAGYEQLEVSIVARNERALSLYRSNGFREFGRNPWGYKTKTGVYQELIFMIKEL